MSRRAARILTVAASLACTDAAPVRVVPMADPFVYNGSAPITLPVQALDASGAVVEAAFDATSDAPMVAEVGGDRLRCLRAGDARIRVTSAGLTTTFVARCRPILSFGLPPGLTLVEGGAPVPLMVVAYDSGGQRVDDLRFRAVTSDTTVIAIRDGVVVPRRMGKADIRLDFGGIETRGFVEVVSPLVRDTVLLAAGEYRAWPLGPGRYQAWLGVPAGTAATPAIAWRSSKANCARDDRVPRLLHCVVDDSGAVVAMARTAARVVVHVDRRVR